MHFDFTSTSRRSNWLHSRFSSTSLWFPFDPTSAPRMFHCNLSWIPCRSLDATSILHRLRLGSTPISLRRKFDSSSSSLGFHLDATSNSLRIRLGFTPCSLRSHIDFTTMMTHWFRFGFMLDSLRFHFGSTWSHFGVTSMSLRSHLDFQSEFMSTSLCIHFDFTSMTVRFHSDFNSASYEKMGNNSQHTRGKGKFGRPARKREAQSTAFEIEFH